MPIENKSACELILNACLKYDLVIPTIFYLKSNYKKAIVWDLDKTCDMFGSKSAAELSTAYMIENNSAIRENKNSFLENITRAQTKENFMKEESALGEIFRSAKISKSFCEKMRDYVYTNFKPAGGMIDALHELLFMNYKSFINSGSFDFIVCNIAENILGLDKKCAAGSILGFDNEGYANGKFFFNIGKQKQISEEMLLEQYGFERLGQNFVSHISDDVISDMYYAKITINDGPFIWMTKEKFASGDVNTVIPTETRYDMTMIPKILRQYEFGRRIISQRTIKREKELTYSVHDIKEKSRRFFSPNPEFEDLKKSVARSARSFMVDRLNQELYPAILSESIKIEFEDDISSVRNSVEKILDILEGTLEFNVEKLWLDKLEN